jgi:hypothetical protein
MKETRALRNITQLINRNMCNLINAYVVLNDISPPLQLKVLVRCRVVQYANGSVNNSVQFCSL